MCASLGKTYQILDKKFDRFSEWQPKYSSCDT